MKKKYVILMSILLLSFVLILPVFAHPGSTDENGCHTCRTNCEKWGLSYGEYHCHRPKSGNSSIKNSSSSSSHHEGDGILWVILISSGIIFGSWIKNKTK